MAVASAACAVDVAADFCLCIHHLDSLLSSNGTQYDICSTQVFDYGTATPAWLHLAMHEMRGEGDMKRTTVVSAAALIYFINLLIYFITVIIKNFFVYGQMFSRSNNHMNNRDLT